MGLGMRIFGMAQLKLCALKRRVKKIATNRLEASFGLLMEPLCTGVLLNSCDQSLVRFTI